MGNPVPWGTWYATHLFTPTGLPIEHEAPTQSQDLGGFPYDNLTCLSEHTLTADLQLSLPRCPSDLKEGIYRLGLFVLGNIPTTSNIPTLPIWHHKSFEQAFLPPIRVGDAAPPHIPWYLLLNEPVDSNRGVHASGGSWRFHFARPGARCAIHAGNPSLGRANGPTHPVPSGTRHLLDIRQRPPNAQPSLTFRSNSPPVN